MELMTLNQLAQQLDLAPPTVEHYLEDFSPFVPAVATAQRTAYPPEAIEVIRTIDRLTAQGGNREEIAAILRGSSPTVAGDSRVGPAERVPDEIAEMRAVVVMLAKRIEANRIAAKGEIAALHAEITALRTELAEFQCLQQAAVSDESLPEIQTLRSR